MHCFFNAAVGAGGFTMSLALLHPGDAGAVRRSTPKILTALCTGAGDWSTGSAGAGLLVLGRCLQSMKSLLASPVLPAAAR
uniref:Uncharacterized protein n=1 Tax=Triticum urartu TaxID=4572 RepID=A0A8R7PUB9_TRIUA